MRAGLPGDANPGHRLGCPVRLQVHPPLRGVSNPDAHYAPDRGEIDVKFRMGHLAASVMAAGLAALLAGCQLPPLGGAQRTASLPPPLPKREEPPEARGIWIVGSGAVEPRMRAVSSGYVPTPDTRPRVAPEGTAAGLRALCAGSGVEYPDMALADRPIRADELKRCSTRGITLSEYALGPRQYAYVKDAHMIAIPGVRDFVESWGVQGTPVTAPTSS